MSFKKKKIYYMKDIGWHTHYLKRYKTLLKNNYFIFHRISLLKYQKFDYLIIYLVLNIIFCFCFLVKKVSKKS